ncbi:MAG: bifunctional enoyl-CoA hydratase/phosphate acetyltransferase [Bacteroidales bacterium]|nr:bifunctional enoyl-CoA hydratase/phosphate acetyltransferase [Bacteroidales bacterium]
MITSLSKIFDIAQQNCTKKLVVAAAEDRHVLEAVKEAHDHQLINPVLVGDTEKIKKICQLIQFDLGKTEIISENNPQIACEKAVQIIREKKADFLMKGLVSTGTLLKAVLDKENGIRKKSLMSHVSLFESPYYHKLLGISDVAMNISPNLNEKAAIIENAVEVFQAIGYKPPKVALLAAVEVINPKMQATIDAAELTKMNEQGKIKNCILQGPLAFDNAVSKNAARLKGIEGEVAGDADLLIVHDINTGNVLYKALNFMGGATSAAVVMGAQVPIVLTSRADSEKSKLMSIALANLIT